MSAAGGRVLSTCTGVERSVYWAEGKLFLIDQKLLPGEFKIVSADSVASVIAKIKDMTVRGAPAIGAAGAFAMAIAANASSATTA
jgi:methylthioribose-1-phosphate isomerase